MTNLAIMEVTQSGDIGGPGVSRFYIGGVGGASVDQTMIDAAAAHLHDLYNSLSTIFYDSMFYSVVRTGRVITVESGLFEREYNVSNPPQQVVGIQPLSAYAAGTGARVQWVTQTLSTKRLMRGTTFFVPLAQSAYNNAGILSPTTENQIQSACNTFLLATAQFSSELHVYHHPGKGQVTGGKSGRVLAVKMTATPAFLRSRRT